MNKAPNFPYLFIGASEKAMFASLHIDGTKAPLSREKKTTVMPEVYEKRHSREGTDRAP